MNRNRQYSPLLLVALVASFFLGEKAFAGEISVSCEVIGCDLTFVGTIEDGDAAAIEKNILSVFLVHGIAFNSPGGNPYEAIKIGGVLNKYFVEMRAPTCDSDPKSAAFVACQWFPRGAQCASACAIAFLVSDHREGSEVLLHRPYLARVINGKLSAEAAHKKYAALEAKLTLALRNKGVGDDVIRQMMETPSEQAVRLRHTYPKYSPWLEEWLIAKCGQKMSPKDSKRWSDLLLILGSTKPRTPEERAEWDLFNALYLQRDKCIWHTLVDAQVEARFGRVQNDRISRQAKTGRGRTLARH